MLHLLTVGSQPDPHRTHRVAFCGIQKKRSRKNKECQTVSDSISVQVKGGFSVCSLVEMTPNSST